MSKIHKDIPVSRSTQVNALWHATAIKKASRNRKDALHEVKIGQTWKRRQEVPKTKNRPEVKIHAINGKCVIVELENGKLKKMCVDDFRPTSSGYDLVRDVE